MHERAARVDAAAAAVDAAKNSVSSAPTAAGGVVGLKAARLHSLVALDLPLSSSIIGNSSSTSSGNDDAARPGRSGSKSGLRSDGRGRPRGVAFVREEDGRGNRSGKINGGNGESVDGSWIGRSAFDSGSSACDGISPGRADCKSLGLGEEAGLWADANSRNRLADTGIGKSGTGGKEMTPKESWNFSDAAAVHVRTNGDAGTGDGAIGGNFRGDRADRNNVAAQAPSSKMELMSELPEVDHLTHSRLPGSRSAAMNLAVEVQHRPAVGAELELLATRGKRRLPPQAVVATKQLHKHLIGEAAETDTDACARAVADGLVESAKVSLSLSADGPAAKRWKEDSGEVDVVSSMSDEIFSEYTTRLEGVMEMLIANSLDMLQEQSELLTIFHRQQELKMAL